MIRFQLIHIRICFLICAALMVLHGCDKSDNASMSGDASLQISLSAPSYVAELKSVSSDPDSPQEWTTWERAVDGRFLYRVTAFLIQGNRLVAHKDLALEGEPGTANIDFEGKFTHGAYILMIVANYSAFEAEDGSNGVRKYDGLSDFSNTVQTILSHGTIDDFSKSYASSFMDYQIASVSGVCRRVPQVLSLVKEIELHPGTNLISGELSRTYSRVRIAVENSSDEDLRLYSMRFADVFTQSKAYIFNGRGYPGQKVEIDVNSVDALTPFTGTENEPLVIPSKGMAVVFDAYILESRKSASNDRYTYSFGIGYDQLNSYYLGSTTAINRRSNVATGRYLMYNRGTGTYLMASSNTSVATGSIGTLTKGMSIPKDYVWVLDNTGLSSNRYHIGTSEALDEGQTAYYMYISNPSSNNSAVKLAANKSNYFTVADVGSGNNLYISFQSNGSGNYRYLGTNSTNVTGQNKNSNNSAQFMLYPVETRELSDVEVLVKTIDPVTGQSEELEYINRNDFINAVVKVTYSKNHGYFIFEVRDWYTGGGDVEFN